MKTYGIGLIILIVSFALSAYPAYMNYNYFANPPQTQDEYTARMEEIKSAALVALITTFLAIIGILVFFIEFKTHVHSHEIPAQSIAAPPP